MERNAAVLREHAAYFSTPITGPPLPATTGGVSAAFLAAALQQQGHVPAGTRVVAMEKETFGKDRGLMGDKCLLTEIRYDPPAPAAPRAIFVKLFPTDPVVPAAMALALWRRELAFLTRVQPVHGFRTPEVFFCAEGEEAASPRAIILMEHVIATPGDVLMPGGLPAAAAVAVARDLAALHAPFWGWGFARVRSEVAAGGTAMFERCVHPDDEGQAAMQQGFYTAGLQAGIGLFSGGTAPADMPGCAAYFKFVAADVWPLLATRWKAFSARLAAMPVALVHGDLTCENIMLHGDSGITFLDFQVCRFDAGVRDLAFLLASSMDPQPRLAAEEVVLRAYHAALAERGVVYSWGDCWRDFVFYKCEAVRVGAVVGMFAAQMHATQTGYFAPDPPAADVIMRRKADALLARAVADLQAHAWPELLRALPED